MSTSTWPNCFLMPSTARAGCACVIADPRRSSLGPVEPKLCAACQPVTASSGPLRLARVPRGRGTVDPDRTVAPPVRVTHAASSMLTTRTLLDRRGISASRARRTDGHAATARPSGAIRYLWKFQRGPAPGPAAARSQANRGCDALALDVHLLGHREVDVEIHLAERLDLAGRARAPGRRNRSTARPARRGRDRDRPTRAAAAPRTGRCSRTSRPCSPPAPAGRQSRPAASGSPSIEVKPNAWAPASPAAAGRRRAARHASSSHSQKPQRAMSVRSRAGLPRSLHRQTSVSTPDAGSRGSLEPGQRSRHRRTPCSISPSPPCSCSGPISASPARALRGRAGRTGRRERLPRPLLAAGARGLGLAGPGVARGTVVPLWDRGRRLRHLAAGADAAGVPAGHLRRHGAQSDRGRPAPRSRRGPPATGIIRVTRHPFMWGVGLWALLHLAANGDEASVIFFGSLAVLALVGTLLIDARRTRENAPGWGVFLQATSNLPFAAILERRQRLRRRDRPLARGAGARRSMSLRSGCTPGCSGSPRSVEARGHAAQPHDGCGTMRRRCRQRPVPTPLPRSARDAADGSRVRGRPAR